MEEIAKFTVNAAKQNNKSLPPLPVEVKHIGKCKGSCNQNIQLHIYEDGGTREVGCKCETFKQLRQEQEEHKHLQFIRKSAIPYSRRQASFDKYQTETQEHLLAKRIAINYSEKFTKNFTDKQLFERVSKYADKNALTIEQANEKLGTSAEESTEDIKTNLILMGTPGTGKTMLSSAIFYNVAEQGFKCFFIESTVYIEMLKESFNDNEKKDTLLRFIEEADLLIVDDIGTSFNSHWAVEQFKMLADKRIGKFTIYTTNLTEKEFINNMALHRIYSRMNQNSHLLKMNFDDNRLKG